MPGTDTDRDAGADEKPAAAPRAPRRLLCSSFRRGYSRLKRPGLEAEPGSSSLPSFIALWEQLRGQPRRRLAPISSIGPQEKNLRAISANCTVTQQRSGEPDWDCAYCDVLSAVRQTSTRPPTRRKNASVRHLGGSGEGAESARKYRATGDDYFLAASRFAREVGISVASPSITTLSPTVHTVSSITRPLSATTSLTVTLA